MKTKIQRLKLKDGRQIAVGQPWIGDDGKQAFAPVQGRADALPVVIGKIRFMPEVEVYLNEEETQKFPAHYQAFGFVPVVDDKGNFIGGGPYPMVDTYRAEDVDSVRALWDMEDVLEALEDSDDDEEEDESAAGVPEAPQNGQQPAVVQSTT